MPTSIHVFNQLKVPYQKWLFALITINDEIIIDQTYN